jgi:hypothetical protein
MARSPTQRPVPRRALAARVAALSRLLLAVGVLLAGLGGRAAAAPAVGRQAMAADAFVDTIGVNLDPTDPSFDRVLAPRLADVGVRFVRADAGPADGPGWARLRELVGRGARVDLVAGADTDWQRFGDAAASLGHGLAALEGSDEPLAGDGPMARFGRVQAALWFVAKATPTLRSVPVLGDGALADLPAGRLDLGGACPGCVRLPGPDPQLQVTSAAVEAPEQVAAAYLPRLWLEQAGRAGRTYLDGLVGDGGRAGLLRPDGSVTPAGSALASLIALLADPGPSFAPGRLAYRLDGADAAVHSLLLAKRDGRFDLALWLERPAAVDPASGQPLQLRGRQVTLRLAAPAGGGAVFRPDQGTAQVAAVPAGATAVPLEVSDRVLLVEVRPAAAPTSRQTAAPAASPAAHDAADTRTAPSAERRAADPTRAAPARADRAASPRVDPAEQHPLAFTGAASVSMVAAAGLLILVGLAALSASRRRYHHRH